MENEFMKRGYLLPNGCKDLSEVTKLKPREDWAVRHHSESFMFKAPAALPPITRQVFIAAPMTVKKLAALLEQKPFRIICDLAQLGIWAEVESVIDFNASSLVARMHGFQAIQAGL